MIAVGLTRLAAAVATAGIWTFAYFIWREGDAGYGSFYVTALLAVIGCLPFTVLIQSVRWDPED
jgi:hypothetical protein